MRRFLQAGLLLAATICIILLPSSLMAQTMGPTGQVHGTILDAKDQKPIAGTTVQLISKADTTQRRITVSDVTGKFGITRVRPGDYTLRMSFTGYKLITRDLSITRDSLNLGAVLMEEDIRVLGDVTVEGQEIRAEQKGDTLIFNAAAYKVNADASAEDLVKKMPGVTIENGQVVAQGQAVRRVLVDGQEFLGDDATAALRNLPAEIINRVQVFDRQSDQAQFTGFDDGNAERTLNIMTKGGLNSAQFGKIYSGLGADYTQGRYNAGGNISFFDGQQRISVIGMSNNMNQQNFSAQDLMGIMGGGGGGGGRGGMVVMGGGGGFGGGGFGGGDFFSGQQSGVNTTHSIGLNYSNRFSEKLNVNGSYFFNNSRNSNASDINRSFFGSEDAFSQIYNESNFSKSTNGNHRANARITWTIDSKNSFIITPRITTQGNTSDSNVDGFTVLPDNSPLNSTLNLSTSDNTAINFGNNILYRRGFEKRGRTFSMSLNTSINNRQGESTQQSTNTFSRAGMGEVTQVIDQITDSPSTSTGWSGNVNYTEPLGTRSQIQLSYNPSVNYSNSERYTYNLDPISQFYADIDSLLSNEYDNTNFVQRGGLSYRYNYEKINFNVGANLQYEKLISDQSFPIDFYGKTSFNSILPDAVATYRFAQNSQLRLQYRASTRTPSISQLQNVIDNSNPLQLSTGNPDLGQQFNHNLNLRYNLTRVAEGQTFFAFLNGSLTQDYLGNSTFIAQSDTMLADGVLLRTGGQLRRPENLGNSQNLRGMVAYSFPNKQLKSNVSFSVGGSLSRNPTMLNEVTYFTNNSSVNSRIGVASTISPQVDFTLAYNVNLINVSYEQPNQPSTNYTQQQGSFQFTWMPKNKFVFISDFAFNTYNGLETSVNQNAAVLNLAVGYKFLKRNAGELRLTGFDLFNQNNSIRRNVTDTYIQDTFSNVLTRYFVMTFTYNLRNFNTGSQPERRPGMGPGFGPPGGMRGRGEF
jgi:hypothetical protein